MTIEIRYQCCEHCVSDPVYHQDYRPDSHDVTCSTGPHNRCEKGDTPVQFDTEKDARVTVPEDRRADS